MTLVRTTIRIPKELKKRVEIEAIKQETSFQNIVITAVEKYLKDLDKKMLKKKVS